MNIARIGCQKEQKRSELIHKEQVLTGHSKKKEKDIGTITARRVLAGKLQLGAHIKDTKNKVESWCHCKTIFDHFGLPLVPMAAPF